MKDIKNKILIAVKAVHRIIKNSIILRFKNNINLNLGAGGTRINNYINIDSLLLKETDLLCNIKNVSFFIKKGSVNHIYASHVFEHFSIRELKIIFKNLYHLLQNKGDLRISVPDFDKISSLYLKNIEKFSQNDARLWMGVIYGGQSTAYDFHKTGFNYNSLKKLLEEAGFKNIKKYDAELFLKEHHFTDGSVYKKEFGDYISLNIIAYK